MSSTTFQPQESPQTGALTIGELARTIGRQSAVFWTTFVIGMLLAVVISLVMPKKYASFTDVLVEGAAANGIASTPENILGELTIPNTTYSLATQQELLNSQEIYFRVLQAAGYPLPSTPEELDALPAVTVRQKELSNVFRIIVEGKDEKMVEAIASNYAEVFTNYFRDLQSGAIVQAIRFLENRIETEKEGLQAAEDNLSTFKVANQVVDTNAELEYRLGLVTQTEAALAEANANVAAGQMNVQELERQLRAIPKTRTRIEYSTNLEELLRLRGQLTDLQVRREGLRSLYLDSAPQVKEVDALIAQQKKLISDIEDTLKREIKESNPQYFALLDQLSDARARYAAATSARNEQQRLYSEREARLTQLSPLMNQQRDLERQVILRNDALVRLNTVLEQFQMRNNQIKNMVTNVRSYVPAQMTQPNWLINMVLGAILSVALAVIFAIARDSLQDKVNTIDDAYALSHHDILARIPERPRSKSALITDPQTSMAFESYRVLRSVIGMHDQQHSIRSLAITSTLPQEGKTVISGNLAIAYALNGQKTILVDSNFRNPAIHRLFGKAEQPGLGDVLLGNATLDEVLQETPVPNLWVVSAGTTPANATEALGSERMKSIIAQMKERSDMVIFDTPSALGLADAPSLASHADASAIVTVLGRPSKAEFAEAVGLMQASSPRLIGIVHNRLKAKQTRLTKV